MSKNIYCLLDIGGTKILSLLVRDNRQVIYREKVPTRSKDSADVLIEQINETVERASRQLTSAYKLAGIGVCIAAFVNFEEGELYGAPNLPFKENVPLKKILSQRWQVPVIVENDANAAVVGEVVYGAAKGFSDVIYVTVSTGIGAGLYLGGKLHRGRDGFAGEIGHFKLSGNNNLCGCGKTGCLESIASGEAMARLGEEKFSGEGITSAYIFEEARRGNKVAEGIINDAIQNLGLSLANLVALLNPECIVIGGGVSKEGELFFDQIKHCIDSNLSISGIRNVKLIKAKLDAESGVWGVFSFFVA